MYVIRFTGNPNYDPEDISTYVRGAYGKDFFKKLKKLGINDKLFDQAFNFDSPNGMTLVMSESAAKRLWSAQRRIADKGLSGPLEITYRGHIGVNTLRIIHERSFGTEEILFLRLETDGAYVWDTVHSVPLHYDSADDLSHVFDSSENMNQWFAMMYITIIRPHFSEQLSGFTLEDLFDEGGLEFHCSGGDV